MRSIIRISVAAAAIVVAGIGPVAANQGEIPEYHGIDNLLTFQDMEKHLGMVPAFFHLFPEANLAAVWNEYKNTQLNPDTALDAKTKQLIGLAVAVQAECDACVHFQVSAALASGAGPQEIQEAFAISAIGSEWSATLTDDTLEMVKKDTDALVQRGVFDSPAASN